MPYDDVTNTHVHTLAFERHRPVIRTNIAGFSSWLSVNEELVFDRDDAIGLEKILSNLPRFGSKEYKLLCEKSFEYFIYTNEETKDFWKKILTKMNIYND
jgi:hypothetical protein